MTGYTDIKIANMALSKLGDIRIASFSENSEAAKKLNAIYEMTRDDVLGLHFWPFAKKQVVLGRVIDSEKVITAATAANPVVITAADHGFSDGDVICITEVVGMTQLNGRTFTVDNATSSTFELNDDHGGTIDGTDYDAYESAGIVGVVSEGPSFKYDYRFTLPDDFIMLYLLNENELQLVEHEIFGNELYANDQAINAVYIAQITDPTKFSPGFAELLSLKLAADLAWPITRSKAGAEQMDAKFTRKLGHLSSRASQTRGSTQTQKQDGWVNGRLT